MNDRGDEKVPRSVVYVAGSRNGEKRKLAGILESAGFLFVDAPAVRGDVLEVVALKRPVATIVDLQDNARTGLVLIRALRVESTAPIIAFGGLDSALAVEALDFGADDYINGGMAGPAVLAHLRAVARRGAARAAHAVPTIVLSRAISIDRVAARVTRNGCVVQMTDTEYRLLDALAANAGSTVRYRELIRTTWDRTTADRMDALRTYVAHLRHKLEEDPAHPCYLLNDWGIGYRFAIMAPECDITTASDSRATD